MTFNPIYTREDLNYKYDIDLTDSQWEMIQEEVANRSEDEDGWAVIEDVCLNLESYEQEYLDWK
jgi:hypothetical protein